MPPRRSRRSATDGSEPSLPLIPILVAVIVLGFVIGAGLSIARRHGSAQNVVVVAPTQRPPTEAPVTPAPTERPTRTPTDAPAATRATAEAATEAPTKAPTEAPTDVATKAASARPERTATARATHSARASVPVAIPLPVTQRATATPAVKRSAAVVAAAPGAASATDAPASTDDVDSEFGRLASAVVRQYLAAVARGDTATAYAAFGAAPGDGNVHLTESGIVGPSARIGHVEVRGAGDNATVNVDLKTPNGVYFGQYTVHHTPAGAALIVDHSIVKP